MKSCPSCQRNYDDEAMLFCLDDGTPLVDPPVASGDPNATWVLPTPHVTSPGFNVADRPRRSSLPWILGIVIVLGISAIGVAFIVTRALLANMQSGEQVSTGMSSPSPADTRTGASPLATAADSPNSPPPAVANNSPGRVQSNQTDAQSIPSPTTTIRSASSESPARETQSGAPRAPISGGVLNGKAVHLVQPPYPAIARAAHVSGTVTVQVLIDENGNVVSANATSGHPLLQASSVAAARASKFVPTKLSGQPVKVTGIIQYNFVAQ
jgi:TonB family protein